MGSPRRLLIVVAVGIVAVAPFVLHRGAPEMQVTADAAPDAQEAPAASLSSTTTSPSAGAPFELTSTTVASTSSSTAPGTSPPSRPRIRPTTTTSPPTEATSSPTTEPDPTTTTTAISCWESYDARCGDFHWDPQPENQPLKAELSVISPSPRAGELVEFKILATDDARISRECYDGGFGWSEIGVTCHSDCFRRPAYGTWSPPAPERDRWEGVLSHVYEQPGTYTVSLTFRSGSDCRRPPSPYLSSGTATVTLTVGERASQ